MVDFQTLKQMFFSYLQSLMLLIFERTRQMRQRCYTNLEEGSKRLITNTALNYSCGEPFFKSEYYTYLILTNV